MRLSICRSFDWTQGELRGEVVVKHFVRIFMAIEGERAVSNRGLKSAATRRFPEMVMIKLCVRKSLSTNKIIFRQSRYRWSTITTWCAYTYASQSSIVKSMAVAMGVYRYIYTSKNQSSTFVCFFLIFLILRQNNRRLLISFWMAVS